MRTSAPCALRWGGYLSLAETIGWKWLGQDEVVLAVFGDEIIGAATYRAVSDAPGSPSGARGSPRKNKASAKTAVVRAWTVRRRERGNGVGRGLMEAVVSVALGEGGCMDVKFGGEQEERAGAKRVLPMWLAGPTGIDASMRKEEAMAEAMLKRIVVGSKRR